MEKKEGYEFSKQSNANPYETSLYLKNHQATGAVSETTTHESY
jgi:hypothetical protein